MKQLPRPAVTTLVSGAVLGGLSWAGLNELGIWQVLKSDLYVGPFLLSLIVGALAAAVPALRRLLWIFASIIVFLLMVVSFTPLAPTLARSFVRADPPPRDTLDAVVVLSGGLVGDSAMSSESLDRLLRGVRVTRDGMARSLVVSREFWRKGGKNVSDSADKARVLAMLGTTVPVYYIDSATSTRDEAWRASKLPARVRWRRIGLVTSPLHTSRACAVFERAGFTVTCIPAESRETSVGDPAGAGDRLRLFQGWFYEMAGTAKYRMKGWI